MHFIEIRNFRGIFETSSESLLSKVHFASGPGRARQRTATRPGLAPFFAQFWRPL